MATKTISWKDGVRYRIFIPAMQKEAIATLLGGEPPMLSIEGGGTISISEVHQIEELGGVLENN